VELLNQVAALRTEVQSLRGDLEQLQQQLEQEREANRNSALDFDGRLRRIEGGAPAASAAANPPATLPAERPPSVHGDAGLLAQSGDERGAYQAAFDTLKSGQYAESARQFQAAMACHAKYLRDRPSSRMTLEGNADERGSREYNLGLGERRGNAVSSALQANGGSGSQVTVVSYGEERPTCTDSNEDCWAKNRRVEIVYTAK
jgi:peptidoglycan-associated lipoprotein